MKNTHKASIYHNGKRLELEIEEYKTLYKAYVIDDSKYFSHIGTLRVMKYKGLNEIKAVDEFRTMCINNKWF